MRITLKQIECLLAVAETGSFSRAAERLNTLQPALSKSIRDLEAELGVKLFDRTTRRVEPTTAGSEFSEAATRILEDLDYAIRDVHKIAERHRGIVKIAAPPLLAATVLPGAIAEFCERFPGIQVKLSDVATDQIVEGVRSGAIDYGLGTFREKEEGVNQVRLVRDTLALFCDKKTRRKIGDAAWSSLSSYPLITLAPNSAIRPIIEIGFEVAQVPLKPAFEVTQMGTVLAMVEAGLGVAVLPSYARTIAAHYKVSSIPLEDPIISRDISFIYRQGRSLSPAASAFSDVLKKNVQKHWPENASGNGSRSKRELG